MNAAKFLGSRVREYERPLGFLSAGARIRSEVCLVVRWRSLRSRIREIRGSSLIVLTNERVGIIIIIIVLNWKLKFFEVF